MAHQNTEHVLDLMQRAQRLGFDLVEVTYEHRPEYVRYDIYAADGTRLLRHTTFEKAEAMMVGAVEEARPLRVTRNGNTYDVDAKLTTWVDDCMNVHTITRYRGMLGCEHACYRINDNYAYITIIELVKRNENAEEVLYR